MGPFHQAPFPDGPMVEVLGGAGAGGQRLGMARVQNVGDRPAAMLAVFTPASFVEKLTAWPVA